MKRTPQQSQLISSFFDLKDNVDFQQKNLMKIEEVYNLTVSPPPVSLLNLERYFKSTDFAKLSNLADPAEIEKAQAIIEQHMNSLEEFGQKLETLEIKLKQYLSIKQGFNKDEELNELKNMIKYLSKDRAVVHKNVLLEIKEIMSESSDDDDVEIEQLGLDEIANFCEMKIQEVVINFHNSLGEEGYKFVEDIRREVEPDLLLVLEDHNDQAFLKEAEINDMKMDKLENDLRELQKTEKKLKNDFSKWEKLLALDESKKKPGVGLSRYEMVKKLDKLGGLKRQWSDSGLYAKDHRLDLAFDKSNKFISNALLLQEIVLDKKEQLSFAKYNFKTEKQNSYSHLKKIFKNADESPATNVSKVEQSIGFIKNKHLKDATTSFVTEYKRMKEEKPSTQKSSRDVENSIQKDVDNIVQKNRGLLDSLKGRLAALG